MSVLVQFHLNGFRTGDPTDCNPRAQRSTTARPVSLPEEIDVLIVGCGPAGLTLAAQLAAFPGMKTRIVDQRAGPLEMGQADGIACRTMEMFEAFGFSERVARESYWVNETCFWSPDDARPEHIVRRRVIEDVENGLSEFPHVILNQARVHDFYLDLMRRAAAPIEPDYALRLVDLKVDESSLSDLAEYPFTAHFAHPARTPAELDETVRARFLVGCDGARSAVRQFMGRPLEGDSASQAWGVMDVLAVTNFPDIRRKTAIHSAEDGSILIIPREGGYLVRLYIELDKLAENQRVANLAVTTEHLIAVARRILNPFTLDVKEVAWWSVYEIGQRLCDRFDDLPPNAGPRRFPRMFIAGDACHTHSPKAGQGMNVSMQDTFNLGWKLASVIGGHASPQLLRTYSAERQAIAKELIDFDHKFSRMFSARPKTSVDSSEDVIEPAEFQDYFVRARRFTAGTATRYRPSVVTGESTHQDLAKGFTVGMRFHSAPVIRLADAKPVHLGHTVRADGRWRLFAFADARSPADPSSRVGSLCEFLGQSPSSPIGRYTFVGDDVDATIEFIAIFQQAHGQLSLEGMPSMLLPRKGRYGLIDYEKIFCPDLTPGHDIFELRGIDRREGALIVVRPDQYVAHVLPLDAHAELASFFDGFMLQGHGRSVSETPI